MIFHWNKRKVLFITLMVSLVVGGEYVVGVEPWLCDWKENVKHYITCDGDEAVVNLPGFSAQLATTSDNLLHIKFDDTLYPCKELESGELYVHPLYGCMVLDDYIMQYNETQDGKFLDAAKKVADSSIAKMREINNALCFYYLKGFPGYTAFYKDMYSGLTQMHYALSLYKLYALSADEKYLDASNKCFNSLTIPIADDGVFWNINGNCFIAEYPFEVPDFVLNGYLDIALNIHEYGQVNTARVEECDYLFKCQVNAVKKYMALFDMPSMHTSRYMLLGPMGFSLKASSNVTFDSCVVSVPTVGERQLLHKKSSDTTIYDSYILDDEVCPNTLKMNIMVSRLSYPKENTITIKYYAKEAGSFAFYAGVGHFSPINVDLVEPQDVLIGEYSYDKGIGEVTIPIKWINEYVFGNPCVFNYKGSGGYYYNAYHYAHIDLFKKIYNLTGDEVFKLYAEKWEEYISHWKNDDIWNSNQISYERYH